jgi:3',5'-cyclic AMP phosphodiesterase CpdA
MTQIAHLTDLHFGAEDPMVVDALVAELNADTPDLVAISGDLTQGARPMEFRAARQFMDRLKAPTLAVPGNHDITPYNLLERFTNPYARWRTDIARQTEPCWSDGTVAVLGLNTARRFGLYWDWSRGRVTNARLDRLIARLDAVPARIPRIVVAHHPLLPPETEPDMRVAGGAARAVAALALHQVTLVLAGHLHRGYARFSSVGDQPPLILQGGTATSVRLRGEPNSYNRVAVDAGGGVSVQVRCWDGASWVTRAAGEADARGPARIPNCHAVI